MQLGVKRAGVVVSFITGTFTLTLLFTHDSTHLLLNPPQVC